MAVRWFVDWPALLKPEDRCPSKYVFRPRTGSYEIAKWCQRISSGADGFHPIYMFPAGDTAQVPTDGNRIGSCDSRVHNVSLEVFETLGVDLIAGARPDGILIMDELGFLETEAERFTRTVLDAFRGPIPILAAVKNRPDVPFLRELLTGADASRHLVTPESRDRLFTELLPAVKSWR